jgi:hypothetical protein
VPQPLKPRNTLRYRLKPHVLAAILARTHGGDYTRRLPPAAPPSLAGGAHIHCTADLRTASTPGHTHRGSSTPSRPRATVRTPTKTPTHTRTPTSTRRAAPSTPSSTRRPGTAPRSGSRAVSSPLRSYVDPSMRPRPTPGDRRAVAEDLRRLFDDAVENAQ